MKSISTLVATVVLAVSGATSWAQAPAPSRVLTWNRIALEAVERAKPTQHQAIRLLAHLSLAQHAAVAETAPADRGEDPVATASMRVIAELMPSQADFVSERHRKLHPRDSAAGAQIAERVLSKARTDGFAKTWEGTAPQTADAWRSLANPPAKPAYPAIGAMRTFHMASGSAFRPASPPTITSARFIDDLAEVRRLANEPTADTTRIAKFYDMTTGTLAGGFWNERAAELIAGIRLDERQSAAILSTVNTAMMDALIASHDAKYTYWVPRPSQVDPSIKTVIGVPNHPSYVSNHSGLSTAAAQLLAHFFPNARGRLEAIATEAGVSRIYAGIHYRFDVEAGEAIGRKVAAAALAGHVAMLTK